MVEWVTERRSRSAETSRGRSKLEDCNTQPQLLKVVCGKGGERERGKDVEVGGDVVGLAVSSSEIDGVHILN